MPSPVVIGAGLGLAVQLYCNALMKLPLMRNPWQHAIAMGAGAAFAGWLVKFEEQTEKELAGGQRLPGRWRVGCPVEGWGHLPGTLVVQACGASLSSSPCTAPAASERGWRGWDGALLYLL